MHAHALSPYVPTVAALSRAGIIRRIEAHLAPRSWNAPALGLLAFGTAHAIDDRQRRASSRKSTVAAMTHRRGDILLLKEAASV
jgi:hypothetical protein